MTNPSFPEYVKIGYAKDVKARLRQLNRSESLPFAFRVYATYAVEKELSDKSLHHLIDQLNPDLRSVENFEGKKRVREFYAMAPEDAYAILEAIAQIHGFENRLHKWNKDQKEESAEQTALEIKEESNDRKKPFHFSMIGLKTGETIYFEHGNYPKTPCIVVDDNRVEYQGETYSLSGLAKRLLGSKWSVQGPKYFSYNGKLLSGLREAIYNGD